MAIDLRTTLQPSEDLRVYDLLKDIGFDVRSWSVGINGDPISNPHTNTYQNSRWAFGGDGQPTVIFLWHARINWEASDPEHVATASVSQDTLDRLALSATPPEEKQRLRGRAIKSSELKNLLYRSFRSQAPINVVLISGTEVDFEDLADSSKAYARRVDPVQWYVHEFDGVSGRYKVVRGVPPSRPDDDASISLDPVEDPEFQRLLGALSETERDALIKVRVNQGLFRQSLLDRWKGRCSVTNCRIIPYLIASHIKPWSKCETRSERLSNSNGLLLTPNLDKAFDRGGISFDDEFRILLSPELKEGDLSILNISKSSRLRSDGRGNDLLSFLQWHRTVVFNRTT